MLSDRPEDTDGYAGLYGEVVTADCYRMRELDFTPDVIMDLGANIGVFSRYVRTLFPDALIIAVEPNPDNAANFTRFTADDNLYLLQRAIGQGQMWWYDRARNGTGEVYVSDGPAYPTAELEKDATAQKVPVRTMMLPELIHYAKPGNKIMIKIDIEGNEQSIFADKRSMLALARADFIAMELHPYAIHGGLMKKQAENEEQAIEQLGLTHKVQIDRQIGTLYARKKINPSECA